MQTLAKGKAAKHGARQWDSSRSALCRGRAGMGRLAFVMKLPGIMGLMRRKSGSDPRRLNRIAPTQLFVRESNEPSACMAAPNPGPLPIHSFSWLRVRNSAREAMSSLLVGFS